MKTKEKKLFEELIDQAEEIKKGKRDAPAYDLWKKRVELLLAEFGREELYKSCFPRIWLANASESYYQEEFLDTVMKIKNLLIATKEHIEHFEDEETRKKAKTWKKHFEIEGGLPFLKGKFGGRED